MDIFNFDPNALLSFYLTLMRFSVVLFLLPFFGGNTIPNPVKAAFLLVLTMAVWPELSFPAALFPRNPWMLAVMFIGEAMLGLILGMLVMILFSAVQFGGHIIGFQMGFAMVSVVDPITGTSEAVSAHFLWMCTMLTFLALNGHLFLISAMGQSFDLIPPGGLLLTDALVSHVLDFSRQLFILAVRVAAPVMAAIFLVDLALALIARTAPQMNVLMLGFPVKIATGFYFLGFLFTILSSLVGDFVQGLGPLFLNIMRAATGG